MTTVSVAPAPPRLHCIEIESPAAKVTVVVLLIADVAGLARETASVVLMPFFLSVKVLVVPGVVRLRTDKDFAIQFCGQ